MEKNVRNFSIFINALRSLLNNNEQLSEDERQGLSEFFIDNNIMVVWVIQKQERNVYKEIRDLLTKHNLSDWLVNFNTIDFEEKSEKFFETVTRLFKENKYEGLYKVFTAMMEWKSDLLMNDYSTIKLNSDTEINVENLALAHKELNFVQGELVLAKQTFGFYRSISAYFEIELKSASQSLAIAEIFEELAQDLLNSAAGKATVLNALAIVQISDSEKQKIFKLAADYPKKNRDLIRKFIFFIFKQMELDKNVISHLLNLSYCSNSIFLKVKQLIEILKNLSNKMTYFLENIPSIIEHDPGLLQQALLVTQVRKGIIKNILTTIETEKNLNKKFISPVKDMFQFVEAKVQEYNKIYRLVFEKTLQKETAALLSETLSKTLSNGDKPGKNNSEDEGAKTNFQPPPP